MHYVMTQVVLFIDNNNNINIIIIYSQLSNSLHFVSFCHIQRDDYRRFQHNQIERARREKINNWIMELGKIIDDNSDDDNDNINSSNNSKNGEALSKGGILEKVHKL